MGKIIISVEDEEKLELLKKFLESVEYVDSVEDFNDNQNPDMHQITYDKYIKMMTMCWEFNGEKKNTEIINKYPELLTKSKEAKTPDELKRIKQSVGVELGNARKVLNFLFKDTTLPKYDNNDLSKHFSEDAQKLVEYVKKGYIAFDSIAQALKRKDENGMWNVENQDIIDLIDEKIEDDCIDISKIHPGHTIISKEELKKYFNRFH